MSMTWRAQAQVDSVVDYLDRHPRRSIDEIKVHLHSKFNYPYQAHYIVYLARNKWGEDILTCKWSYRRSCFVYSFAETMVEVHNYLNRRLPTPRGHIRNMVGLLDRAEQKFPTEISPQTVEWRQRLEHTLAAMNEHHPAK